ncbi:MAG: hypothetical protein JRI41_05870 [Deltaproteobacteria bacterium]|nr:hypothetical protein [Deltaproteobacteria bacterium]
MANDKSTFWIIGAGKFGTKAAERLCRKRPDAIFIVVDQDAAALKRLANLPVKTVYQEGASYLGEHLVDTEVAPEWIIPAIPVHLAFEWVRLKMSASGGIEILPVPLEVEKMVPNPIRGPEGQLYISYADFICPDNCTEPLDICTFTGKPRKGILYRTLGDICYKDFTSVVVRSHQLAPVVGGFRPEALWKSLNKVVQGKGPILYSTACLCHGVMHAFRVV